MSRATVDVPPNLLGNTLAAVLPGEPDVANSGPVAVHPHHAEGQGYPGDPGAAALNQEVDEDQGEGCQQRQHRPVLRAANKASILQGEALGTAMSYMLLRVCL